MDCFPLFSETLAALMPVVQSLLQPAGFRLGSLVPGAFREEYSKAAEIKAFTRLPVRFHLH